MCFGSGDQGWRPFTLYILMRSGDVYALTPVVPSRWNVSRDYIQRLSLEITSELDSFDEQTSLELKSVIRHQTKWINDVLNQQAVIANAQLGFSTPRAQIPSCFKRPEVVGPSPVLQGPFLFDPAPVETGGEDYPAACDIFHLEAGPVGVIGIVYSDGKLDICLETDPITAKWVDKKRKPKAKAPGDHSGLPVIASYETINLQISAGNDSEYTSWPVFTPDPHSNQLWFVNHRTGVVAFSMKGWLGKLEEVLEDDEDGDFLTRMLENSPRSLVQNIVDTSGSAVDGCAVVYEAYIGYLLVAGHRNGLSSVEFDEPVGAPAFLSPEDSADNSIILDPPQRHRFAASVASTPRRFQSPDDSFSMPKSSQQQQQQQQPTPITLPAVPKVSILQPPYQASPEFTRPSALPEFLRGLRHAKQPFMFSSTTLKKFREARDTLKAEFDALMSGAQEMHDRAAAQRLEYSKQLETLNSIDARLGALQSKAVRERLERFITRQEALQERADTLLRRLIVDSEVGLSDAEKKWSREVNLMMMRVIGEEGTDTLSNRQFAVSELVDDLVPAAEEVEEDGEVGKDMVPKEVREATLKGLRQMIDRQYVPPPKEWRGMSG